ncbi:hypothetical protein [Microbulbifer hainanensis]|uniref:hypothetical protein n=1 Tax=Microbulbifer hainanensis TaxID=2735675 RepID=UPI00186649D5|nr:hypothetical protein [Microbulbifer hainanensis]
MRNVAHKAITALMLASVLAAPATAEEAAVNLESTIIGNREEPNVLYIIPWKQADSLKRLESSLPQTIGDVFAHREYSELQREIEQMQSEQQIESKQ